MSIKTATLDGIATIEIARPEKKNALTQAMYQAMADALRAAQADPAVRAVLFTGQPGIFTSGNDLEDFMRRPPQGPESPVFRFMRALLDCDKPVIAAVTGAAIGIGTTMLLHCDFVYVSDEARLAMPFVSLGLVPEFASSLLVPQRMGHVRAAEKLLLGDPFTGAEAVECGIANAVLPAAEVVNHARRVAERFNAPTLSVSQQIHATEFSVEIGQLLGLTAKKRFGMVLEVRSYSHHQAPLAFQAIYIPGNVRHLDLPSRKVLHT
ncbi:MAG: enoyl-CoA hydratase [Burkholderiales bacterium]|nr:enoyl-CoA hydratase [Burkholderiales bacterium]